MTEAKAAEIEKLIEREDYPLEQMWANIFEMPRSLYRNGPVVSAHPSDVAKAAALRALSHKGSSNG